MSNPMNKQRMLDRFLKYAQCDSVSGTEKDFCLMLEEELTAMGYAFERDEEAGKKANTNGWNLLVRVPGSNPELTPMMLCAHLDTVAPGNGIKPVIDGDYVRSSGDTILAADDKSGIAVLFEMLETWKETGTGPERDMEFFFTVCEEAGLFGALHADYSKLKSKMGLALDATGYIGNITYRSPSIHRMFFEIIGKPSHAAINPDGGINALKTAVEAISNIPTGRVDPESVLNVANLQVPGEPNVVPDKATFAIEIRSFTSPRTEELENMCLKAVEDACAKTGCTWSHTLLRVIEPAYVPETTELIQLTTRTMKSLGVEPELLTIFGGSDATHFFNNGIDACCIGTGMDGAHSLGETLYLPDFYTCADMCWKFTLA